MIKDNQDKKKSGNLLKSRKELEKLNRQLKENAKTKNMFIAAMSHEIRTPMNAILGSTHLLKKAKTREEQKEFIDIIDKSGNLLLGIINNVLDYSKLEAGKSILLENCFSLRKVSDELCSILSGIANDKGLEFTIRYDIDLSTEIIGDDVRLNQILLNLCNNAVKYTNKGQVVVNIEKVSESDEIVKYKFSVIDTGVGITKNNIKYLFKPFSQFNPEANNAIEGTGLGLSIVKNTVDLMGGKLGVESARGFGSTFWFELEFKKLIKKERRNFFDKRRTEYAGIKKDFKILIADNDRFSRIIVEKILISLGYNSIDTVVNGQEAVEQSLANDYDIIFMDRMMPVMNGLEATAAIRKAEKSNKSTRIIALSADALIEDRGMCFDVGMDYFLLKPVNPQILDDTIRQIILNNYIPKKYKPLKL